MMRLLFERLCRTVALVALLVAAWVSACEGADPSRTPRRMSLAMSDSVVADTGSTGVEALRPALQDRFADTAEVTLRVVPGAPLRAALSAMQAAGVAVRWTDSTGASGLAMSVSRAAAPGAPLFVRASGSLGAPLLLRDGGGVLDSIPHGAPGVSWQLQSATTPLAVQQGLSRAQVPVPASAADKRVLVMAQPGWEGKFTVAALEELGWRVDGRLRVSPSGVVTVGTPERLDLERYAAVVIVDSLSIDGAALQSFVTRGGGLVLGGDALQIAALTSLRPARATVVRGAVAGALLTIDPRRGLDAWELDLTAGAVTLAEDASGHGHREPALIARRSGRGRVVAMPYRETWRWRMQGTDTGAEEHRRWWQAALVAAVPSSKDSLLLGDGPASRDATVDALPGAAAPYADLVARLGPGAPAPIPMAENAARPGDERRTTGHISRILSAPLLLLVTLLALLAEWSSRRLRGQR